MSLAVSCAHELRLDQPLPVGVVEQYRFLTGLPSLSAEVLNRSRQRSQQVVYGLELKYVSSCSVAFVLFVRAFLDQTCSFHPRQHAYPARQSSDHAASAGGRRPLQPAA